MLANRRMIMKINHTLLICVVAFIQSLTLYFACTSSHARLRASSSDSNVVATDNNPFIVEVYTTKPDTEVIIPITSSNDSHYDKFKYNHSCDNIYTVNCGDGILINKNDHLNIHCFYKNSGTHDIFISGQLHGIRLVDHNDISEIRPYYFINVKQWGNIPWHDLSYFADSCKWLTISANDAPNLRFAKVIDRMFSYTHINININHWNVSQVESMHGMFMGNDVYNQPMDNWDTSQVFNMSNMFEFATSFNQPLTSWDVSNVTNMREMFGFASKFNQPLDLWNVSNVLDMTGMFIRADSFNQDISNWKFYGVSQCLNKRYSSEEHCITYMFSYSNNSNEHKDLYQWLEDRFDSEDVLCNIDINDCSLYDE